MPGASVVLTRCDNYQSPAVADALHKQFSLLGGLGTFVKRGDRVLLKPNLIAPRSRRHACQTDPAVIAETARILKDFGARPFVGDSPAWGNVFSSIKALRLERTLRDMDVPVKQLDNPVPCPVGPSGVKVGISAVALDADVIMNLPKFKTHQQLVATFAVKNLFGCVSGKRKALLHFTRGGRIEEFCEMLISIYQYVNPVLTIIDAVAVMDGPGPIRGRARPLGWLIGGTDAVACEAICCRLVNLEPQRLPILQSAERLGLGSADFRQIEIRGDDFSKHIVTDFELPHLIPVRFSLPHVFKSVAKQVVTVVQNAVGMQKG